MNTTTISIDAFGGDNAPDEVLKGVALAIKKLGLRNNGANGTSILLVGDEDTLNTRIASLSLRNPSFDEVVKIINANGTIEISDNPADIRTTKADSSMGVCFSLVKKGEADAMVSAGSTAALVVGGATVIGRIRGIKRPALAPIMPSVSSNYILLDGGANLVCREEMLLQFALMGSVYLEKAMGINSPRVGLLNVGTETEKGRELEHNAYSLLKNAHSLGIINFIGNIEGRDVPLGGCDVLVTDGFTGNVFLKTVEGMGGFLKSSLNSLFKKNLSTKVGYLFSKGGVIDLKKKTSYKEVGGSPLLGTKSPVIKAHGSSDALAFYNAIRQARDFVNSGVTAEIENRLKMLKST